MDNTKQVIFEAVKKSRANRFLSNCYDLKDVDHCKSLWSSGDEIVFSYEDHGVERLSFFVKDWNSLNSILNTIEQGRFFLEFLTKAPEMYVPAGSTLTAKMMRLTNIDCRSVFNDSSPVIGYKNSALVENALESDTVEINQILWSAFRTEVSHLLSDEELRETIKAGHITVHRTAGHIDAILQANVLPKKFYINQIINKGDKNIVHAILLDRLEEYINAGGKYLYAWVEETNIASQRFHEKYGMKHDGMWSMIYCLER